MKIKKLISGGQTGADRAALDFAIKHGIPHGGWCPKGRIAEDGRIPAGYLLQETPLSQYEQRTEWNVRDSDGTVLFTDQKNPSGGTRYTAFMARKHAKPCFILCLEDQISHAALLSQFLADHRIQTLNVAGPRASKCARIGDFVHAVLTACLW